MMPPMMPQCPRRSFGPGAEDGRSLLSARRPVATSSSVAIAADAASAAAPAAAAVALRPGAVLGATSVVLRQGKAVLGRVMAPAVHGGVGAVHAVYLRHRLLLLFSIRRGRISGSSQRSARCWCPRRNFGLGSGDGRLLCSARHRRHRRRRNVCGCRRCFYYFGR